MVLTGQSSENPNPSPDTQGISQRPIDPSEGVKSRLVTVVWAIACMLIVAIVSGVYVVDRAINITQAEIKEERIRVDSTLSIPASVAEKLAEAFETKASVNAIFIPVIREIKQKPKFVVMVTTLNVTVKKENLKTAGGGGLDLGTTTVTLRANGNRVQYFVPLEGAGINSFEFDPQTKVLTATFPPVRIDKDVVDVQNNPSMIDLRTDVGWARLDRYSGEDLRGQVQKDLRGAVVEEAGMPLLMDKARETARRQLMKLLEPVQMALKEDVTLRVKFEGEPDKG